MTRSQRLGIVRLLSMNVSGGDAMQRVAGWMMLAAVVSLLSGCNKSNDTGGKAPAQAETTPTPPPVAPPKAEPPTPPPPPPKPNFDRQALLAAITPALSRCILFDPAVQFLKDNVVRIQYVHGCGEFEKPDAAKVMWKILQEAVGPAIAAGVDMPTFKIQAFTRNGSSMFTSTTTPKDVARLVNKDIGFDDWLVHIGEGRKKLAASPSELEYLKALPQPAPDMQVPEGDELKGDLAAYVEDLQCSKDVSKLVLGKVVTLNYKEVCGHYEDADARLTMYEIALRIIAQFDKHGVWAGLNITARAENGGGVFVQSVPAQVLQGIKDRQVGIIDWVTRSYPGGAAPQAAAPRRNCHEGEGCVLLPADAKGTSAYLECETCCYGVDRGGVGMFPFRCKGQGEQ